MRYGIILFSTLFLFSCKKDYTMGDAPSDEDAQFAYVVSLSNANTIEFTASNPDLQCLWDLGNGIKKQGSNVTGEYPYAGTYTVKLTVFGNGGSKSSSQIISIAQDDLTLLNNPFYNKLTGGVNGPGFKVWHVDSAAVAHLGVGPDPESALGSTPEYWASSPNEKPGCGIYDDRYIFYLNGFKFDMVNHGDVYIHNTLSSTFPGSFQNLFDYTAPYTDQLDESWQITEGTENVLSVSNNAFLGFYSGFNTYRILEITDTTMYLQYAHHAGGLLWYLKLKSE
ncbi:MAG: PKD domain-containing protein [Bacteroidota bacterium]|jgi:PKD repeat protein